MTNINIYNEDCFDTMHKMVCDNKKVNIVLTSPPYNTGRNSTSKRSRDNFESRYDVHIDNMTDEEYINWTIELFNMYDNILEKNGVILYNISYGNENPNLMWLVISEIISRTNFMVADCIIWKKNSALPNNVSHNKLTRITEFVFVICRKDEYKTFQCNKKVKSVSKTGQKYYENVFNFIEAKNNDGVCEYNKATYSSDLCLKLLNIYSRDGDVIYDSFNGSGTTGVACKMFNNGNNSLEYIGSEISENQVKFSLERINKIC